MEERPKPCNQTSGVLGAGHAALVAVWTVAIAMRSDLDVVELWIGQLGNWLGWIERYLKCSAR